MKICILGAGALGSTIGGALAEAGCDVTLVSRRSDHVEAIRRDGLRIVEDGRERVVGIRACRTPAEVGPVDLIVVLVKSSQTAEAISSAAPLLGPATTVLSLQNGLGHEEIIAAVVGSERVIGGKTYVGGVFLGPGKVRAGIDGKETVIGELDGSCTARVQGIATAFGKAGLDTRVSGNIMATIWDKLLVNVATGALSAISGLPYGPLYAVAEIESCALEAVAEAMAVARAAGIALATREPREAWVKAADGLPPEFRTSMLQSLEKGSATEIDFINGAVMRWGVKLGVPTPVNRTLVACIKGIERRIAAEA